MPVFGPPNVEKLKAKRHVKGLIKALGYQKDPAVRKAAAEVLGEIKDARAVEPLISALRDTHKNMRQAAAEALGKLGDIRAVEPLIGELGRDVRQVAAKALGLLGDARAVEPLIVALKDRDNNMRQTAAVALGMLGDVRAVEPLLIAKIKDIHGDVRQVAAKALGMLSDTRAVEPLIAALENSDKSVRRAAAEALDKFGWKPDQDETGATYWVAKPVWYKCVAIGARAVEPLIAALKDENVSQGAVEALVGIGAPAVEPLIAALKDGYGNVRMSAAKALEQLKDVHGAPASKIKWELAEWERCEEKKKKEKKEWDKHQSELQPTRSARDLWSECLDMPS